MALKLEHSPDTYTTALSKQHSTKSWSTCKERYATHGPVSQKKKSWWIFNIV